MIPDTVSTPRSPRLVTVIVGSDSWELRSDPLRARPTIAQPRHQHVERKPVRIADGRRDEPAAPHGDRRPDVNAGARLEPAGGEEAVEFWGLAEGTRDCLEQ